MNKEIEEKLNDIMCKNYCENDVDYYLHYLTQDIYDLQDYKLKGKKIRKETAEHLIEEITLLIDIIKILTKGEQE